MMSMLEYIYNTKVLLVIIGIYLFLKLGRMKHNLHLKLGHRGPPPLPFIGNLLDLYRYGIHEFDKKSLRTYGNIYPTYTGGIKLHMVADEEVLKQIMVKDFKCFPDRLDLGVTTHQTERIVGMLKGKEWERVRSLITPTFTTGKLKKMSNMINEVTKLLNERLHNHPEGEVIQMKEFFGALTMDGITRTMLGLQIDSQSNPNNKFVLHGRKMGTLTFFNPVIAILVMFPEFKNFLKKFFFGWEFFGKDAVKFFTDVIKKTISEREKSTAKYNDFLAHMLKAQQENNHVDSSGQEMKALTDQEIIAQCLIFLLEGFESVASTLTFTSYFLAMNQDAQQEVYDEIVAKIGKKGEITYNSLQDLPLLDAAISETLRLCPSNPRNERTCVQDITLVTSDEETIHAKSGDIFCVPVYAIHMDPNRWPDPERYDIHRFDPDSKHSPYSYLPFGIGPRSCFGMRYALFEAKWCLVSVLQNFKFKPAPETMTKLTFKKTMFTSPTKPVLLKVEKRD